MIPTSYAAERMWEAMASMKANGPLRPETAIATLRGFLDRPKDDPVRERVLNWFRPREVRTGLNVVLKMIEKEEG